MEAYPGGLGYPRGRCVHSARHTLWQPIIDSVSRSTALLPGVLDGSRFNGTRLWNRSVFGVSVVGSAVGMSLGCTQCVRPGLAIYPMKWVKWRCR